MSRQWASVTQTPRYLVARASGKGGSRSRKRCTNPAGAFCCNFGMWGGFQTPIFLNGALPVAPSAIAPEGHVRLVRPERPYVTPRALETDEIPAISKPTGQGALNAKAAGFDGVEVHARTAYLLDQFLQDKTYHRTDLYGGPIENRARLLLEVTDAVISVWGAGRVGVHLAPRGDSQDMGDSNPLATLGTLRERLGQRGIAFILCPRIARRGRIGPPTESGLWWRLHRQREIYVGDGE